MHKWCDQTLFTSGRRRSQADIIYRYAQKPAIHTMMRFSTIWAVIKVWKYKIPVALPFPNGLPTFLGLTRISALLPGQLVLEYSILMSMTRKSFGSQLGSSTMISLLKKKWNAPWYSPRLAPTYMSASVHSMLPQFSETRKILPSYLVSTPNLRRSNFIIHILVTVGKLQFPDVMFAIAYKIHC